MRLWLTKSFLLPEECAARIIHLHIPPGKRSKTQMDPNGLPKETKIANLWILIEQVIWRLKCFRILANEMVINQFQYADDVLWVALSSL